jgi:hypothetical protein
MHRFGDISVSRTTSELEKQARWFEKTGECLAQIHIEH